MADRRGKNWLLAAPVRIILPVVLTLALFVGTIFLYILPILERRMLDDRRLMIRELTDTAWSALVAYREKEVAGELSRREAQQRAAEALRRLRYGPESKDYFWINDMHPRLVMHPYRPDLEGTDISDYTDPNGKRLFVAFVETVRAGGAGYVDYRWQWKDDPDRIVPKISYVRGFPPWGWIIGTGIYVEDVRAEIAAITRQLTTVCLLILVLIVGLSGYVIAQSARSERNRQTVDAALRESEEKYRLLAETAREFIIAFDVSGRIVYANRAWLAAGGFTAEQLRAKTVSELLPESARSDVARRLQSIGAGQPPATMFETELLTAAGSTVPVEAVLAPLMDDEKTLRTFITARDVTEKKRAEKQAELHREQLFQADKMATLGTLVSGVAHEINNPVTFVMLNAPILQQAWSAVLPILDAHRETHGDFKVGHMDYSQLRERIPLLLANIVTGAERVKTIVGDLKDFARQGPSRMTDTVDLNAVAAKAVALAGNLIRKSTQRFVTEYGRPMPTFVGNAQKIEQVVINLLVNACQALPDSRRRVRLATGSTASPACAFIEIEDEGGGMTEAVLQRIRDPFFTTKRESGGTGLGLAIADRIVQEHGGSMAFASEPDRGTTVRVMFPAHSPPHSQEEAPHE